jgi:CelD/BcsL family acetyltransferase involved in cellulose biosynthesis
MITVTRADSAEALAAISSEWTGIVESDPSATPFHRPEWLIPWWRAFGSGQLHALMFRFRQDRSAGFVPLFIHEWNGRRQVTLAGNGVTDYLGLTHGPGAGSECARLTFDYLRGERWDVCDWADLPADPPLTEAVPADFGPVPCNDLPCTRAVLPRSAGEFEDALPHGLRRTLRLAQRRLEDRGPLKFETFRGDPGRRVIEELFRLHECRWAHRGGPESMLDQPCVQRFLMEASARFSALGKLRLYALSHRGELAAVILALFDRSRAWGYITGMDPELARFSPGSLVLRYAIADAITEGAAAWEFLRGDEAYKFQWGAQWVPKVRLRG